MLTQMFSTKGSDQVQCLARFSRDRPPVFSLVTTCIYCLYIIMFIFTFENEYA